MHVFLVINVVDFWQWNQLEYTLSFQETVASRLGGYQRAN